MYIQKKSNDAFHLFTCQIFIEQMHYMKYCGLTEQKHLQIRKVSCYYSHGQKFSRIIHYEYKRF